MKKSFYSIIALALLIVSSSAMAQDVIFLNNGEEVQALVQKIGVTEIEYKKFSNPNGPSYVIERTSVLMIKYQNGEKDIFAKTTQTQAQEAEKNKIPPQTQAQEAGKNKILQTAPLPVEEATAEVPAEDTLPSMLTFRKGAVYDANGKPVSDNRLRNIYAGTPDALQAFESSKNSGLRVGWGISTGLMLASGIMSFVSILHADADAFLTYGVITAGFFIPYKIFSVSMDKRLRQSVDLYNKSHVSALTKSSNVAFQFGLKNSGELAFVINF